MTVSCDVVYQIKFLYNLISGKLWSSLLKNKGLPFVLPLKTRSLRESFILIQQKYKETKIILKKCKELPNDSIEFPLCDFIKGKDDYDNIMKSFENIKDIGKIRRKIDTINIYFNGDCEVGIIRRNNKDRVDNVMMCNKISNKKFIECLTKFLYLCYDCKLEEYDGWNFIGIPSSVDAIIKLLLKIIRK